MIELTTLEFYFSTLSSGEATFQHGSIKEDMVIDTASTKEREINEA